MDKKAAAAALGVTVRRVEKFDEEGRLGEKRYVRGRTGKQRDFEPEAVERLKFELESVDTATDGQPGGGALMAPAQVQAFRQLAALLQSARPVDTRPVLLTTAQAVEASGLPATWLHMAVRAKAIEQIGRGRASRLRRDEVLTLAAREDLAALVDEWRKLEQVGTEKKSPVQSPRASVRGKSAKG